MRKSFPYILTVLYMAFAVNIAVANPGDGSKTCTKCPTPSQPDKKCCQADHKDCKVTEIKKNENGLTLAGVVGTALLNKKNQLPANNSGGISEKDAGYPTTDDAYPGFFILHSIMRF